MYRNKEIKIRLTEKELQRLDRNVAKTTFSREGFIRKILSGYTLVEQPPVRYWELIRELRDIAGGMRSMYYKLRVTTGDFPFKEFSDFTDRILSVCDELQDLPIPRKTDKAKI